MNVPKYIENALEMRAKHAEQFNHYDFIISNWIEKHDVITESCDTRGGVESIVNPYASSNRVLQAILNTDE
ncbi:MAG: hypothetical protein IJZ79_02185 [Bacilli bacterium]|nr:hypothetical protein [Bacilli bacterium]